MRTTRLAAGAAAALACLTLAVAQGLAQEKAPPEKAPPPAEKTDKPAEEKPEYVGDKACQKCHFAQHKSWKKTGMAKSMNTLRPTAEAADKGLFDRKVAAKLDPAKDYTADGNCLKCHTTGYGLPGGYPVDAKKDEAAVKLAVLMGAVSCEACHGPGSLYVKHKSECIEKDKDAKFTFEGLAKIGLIKPDEKNCATCHNSTAPTQPVEPFVFAAAKAKSHDHPKK